MKRTTLYSNPARRGLQVLVWAAALTMIACTGDMNFSPTAPTSGDFPFGDGDFPFDPDGTLGPGRNLAIVGSLTAEQGTCFEATVLYDGKELAGARTVCREPSGCTNLKLTAFTTSSTSGRHTISFQVLRQSSRAVPYLADATVRVSRDGISWDGVNLPLGWTHAKLRAGESVDFDFGFQN